MTKVEEMILQLKRMTCERDELCEILAHYMDKDLHNRFDFEFISLTMEHQKMMTELKKLSHEIREASDKFKMLTKETESFHLRHFQLMIDHTKLKIYVNTLRNRHRKLLREHSVLQTSCEDTKRLCEEAVEKICGLCAQKQQELGVLEERLQDILKMEKLATQEQDFTKEMEYHTDDIEMRSETAQCDLEGATAQEESAMQSELLQRNN
ncbi:disks large homolog 5-like isoform X2 [Meriones unguiculatus]|uniref:disks large homolog 5-like isoform X2 n=1 Tax=Meriones unguiculatus TaxID=10047 RepID=UPI00293EE0BC|nr:disks large homolog 5-like isoform X2 [Meriones unguiculatus]